MKLKTLALIFSFAFLGGPLTYGLEYQKTEVKKIKEFLKQTDGNLTNAQKLNITDINNPATYTGVSWTEGETARVSSILWANKYLFGKLDLSKMAKLKKIDISNNYISELNLDSCLHLSSVDASLNRLAFSSMLINGEFNSDFKFDFQKPIDLLKSGALSSYNLDLKTPVSIDLSQFREPAPGKITDFKWLRIRGDVLTELNFMETSPQTGIYVVDNSQLSKGDILYVEMRNSYFKGIDGMPLLLVSTKLRIDIEYNKNDSLKLASFLVQQAKTKDGDIIGSLNANRLGLSLGDDFGVFPGFHWLYKDASLVLDSISLGYFNYTENKNADHFDLAGYLDLSQFGALKYLDFPDQYIDSLDLSGCDFLDYLNLRGNPLGEIDINSLSRLKQIDLSNCSLEELVLRDIYMLESLKLDNNFLDTLHLNEKRELRYLSCKNNRLSSLTFLNYGWPAGSYVDLSNNRLMFSDFSFFFQEVETFIYSNQAKIDLVAEGRIAQANLSLENFTIIDLSSEYNPFYNNEFTKYTWIKLKKGIEKEEIFPKELVENTGVFIIDSLNLAAGDLLYLGMDNEKCFPYLLGSLFSESIRFETRLNPEDSLNLKNFYLQSDDKGISNADKLGLDMNSAYFWGPEGSIAWKLTDKGEMGLSKLNFIEDKDLYGDFDFSNSRYLEQVQLYNERNITGVNLSFCDTLRDINLGNLGIKKLNIEASPNLEHIYVNNTNLENFEASNLEFLIDLELSDNKLVNLNLRTLPNLSLLNCEKNRLQALNVQAFPRLTSLKASSNDLESIELRFNHKLKYLDIRDNKFDFSSLDAPILAVASSLYSPQKEYRFKDIIISDSRSFLDISQDSMIDLRTQYYGYNGSQTEFEWFILNGGPKEVDIQEMEPQPSGLFLLSANKLKQGDSVYLRMTNPDYPQFSSLEKGFASLAFIIADSIPGDIKLEYHVIKGAVALLWESDLEKEDGIFQIERSEDSLNWASIATIKSSSSQLQYNYLDEDPLKVKAYYRVGFLGSTKINTYLSSNIISVPKLTINLQAKLEEGFVDLKWINIYNGPNDYYRIERSGDMLTWKQIGFIGYDPEGNYAYQDSSPLVTTSYYRIVLSEQFNYANLAISNLANIARLASIELGILAQFNGDVILQWKAEQNSVNEIFHVERSLDTIHWEDIADLSYRIDHLYEYIDSLPLQPTSYYRIRIYDQEDSEIYIESNWVSRLGVQNLSLGTWLNEDASILLSWMPDLHNQNDLYRIDRSEDSLIWESIAYVNYDKLHDYNYIDKRPSLHQNYYRVVLMSDDAQNIFCTSNISNITAPVFVNLQASLLADASVGMAWKRSPSLGQYQGCLERSLDETNWETLLDINANYILEGSFVDSFPPREDVYYRLRFYDQIGEDQALSQIINIKSLDKIHLRAKVLPGAEVALLWDLPRNSVEDVFLIQRSENALLWQEISKQEYRSDLVYTYEDNMPNRPVSYYRIILTDAKMEIYYSISDTLRIDLQQEINFDTWLLGDGSAVLAWDLLLNHIYDHFEIEKSPDSNHWYSLSSLNYNPSLEYSFVDHNPYRDKTYYRIILSNQEDNSYELISNVEQVSSYFWIDLSALVTAQNQVALSWSAQARNPKDLYRVERRPQELEKWEPLAYVYYQEKFNYGYIDKKPLDGISNYRVVLTDSTRYWDHCFSESVEIKRVATGNEEDLLESQLILYPNPSQDHVNVYFPGAYHWELYNTGGILIKKSESNELSRIELNLPAGIYILKIRPFSGGLLLRKLVLTQ